MRVPLLLLLCVGIGGAYAQEPDSKIDDLKMDSTIEASTIIPVTPSRPVSPIPDETHIMGVVPNYATVNDPARPFQSIPVSEKFKLAAQDAFDPFSWVVTAFYAGAGQWGNNYSQFGQGLPGYAKRYGAAFADGAIGNYLTEAILPSILHEDPRYFRMGMGSNWKRVGYALTRVLVTRTDKGKLRFDNSELEGNMIAAVIANLYYPSDNRSVGNTLEKFTVNVVSDAGFNVLKEFWPDMRRKVLRRPDPEPQYSVKSSGDVRD